MTIENKNNMDNRPFKWNESKNIKINKSLKVNHVNTNHISIQSCVAIPEDFVVNHTTPVSVNNQKENHQQSKQTPVLPLQQPFPNRKSSLQQQPIQINKRSSSSNNKISSNTINHNRLPSQNIPNNIKSEIEDDRDWAIQLINDAFKI